MRHSQKHPYTFTKMTCSFAEEILFWRYPPPYDLYNLEPTKDCLDELLSGDYYACMDMEGDLAGYCCTGEEARVPGGYDAGVYDNSAYIDIGIGMKPCQTGKGRGRLFLSAVLTFLGERHRTGCFRLVVIKQNERAIRLYERAGFVKNQSFLSPVSDRPHSFVCMKKEGPRAL
ncbi:GNAT family N-acetyltransferase [Alteribacter lacisalsi]|uniref:GNAT family N-acetyltransferase n=1 Tax=Alteribacter lacisalsi TaxID=2045244 RepID=A0A2W0H414_9BACI|nr:GNAT family N-acetyltransferase [Alteribacter lacisalsi]PYZ96574.1 GNAT family N-acetyltransferase [Alteribacter lacisalsi]